MKQSLIGVLILGSLFVQAARPVGRPRNPFRNPPIRQPKINDDDLVIKYGRENVHQQLFNNALFAVWNDKDPELTTTEGVIIYEMTRYQRTQIILSEEWSKNGARENAIQFLKFFVTFTETLPLDEAFNRALKKVGLAAPSNLEKMKQNILQHLQNGTLYKAFRKRRFGLCIKLFTKEDNE